MLISHLHHDHLDPPSLRMLGEDMPLFVPQGAGDLMRRKGFRRVTEMSAGADARLGPLRISATYAAHSPARQPFGPKADCLGYIISGRYSLYFPGDTDLFPGMDGLYEDLDVALMPVWVGAHARRGT